MALSVQSEFEINLCYGKAKVQIQIYIYKAQGVDLLLIHHAFWMSGILSG